ncbi:uncharacterized protein B0H18DRAFT_952237 [Fomitopsis serialis]|uniref:uncharacterized protein n=1 Tax=Fomitopsis serialis TaxID=139415 RepID=UPI00200783F4|nr:uncharacterized protein B0H18DRAFT_952237 [Neoantrodia serialis]KAH9932499.1 hypothetical protein B0H18DRAFT_952237 [Neoantrodia serialis]
MKSLLKIIRKKGDSKVKSKAAKQDDRGETEAPTMATSSTVGGKANESSPPPSSNGALLAPPVVARVNSGASSSESGANTPSPEEEAETAQALVKLETTGAESGIWALVIAINDYPTAPLQGDASRESILSTFRRHLIENDAINKGDGIIFFFAGHGTREYASEDWGLDGDIVECICPQDLNFTTVHGIPSTTLNGLFRELAHVKGDNITSIFDCCHSGTITRKERGLRYLTPPRDVKPVIPSTTDADARKWWPGRNEGNRAAKNVVPTSFRYDAMKSHVLMSACRAEEEAMERIVERTKAIRGFFTSTLLEVLDQHEGMTAGLTYAYLFEELLPATVFQHPQCLGKHKNRLLWNTTIKIVNGFRITVRNGSFVVHAGRIHGIAPRTTFTVQARDETDRNLGTLVVSDLKDLEATFDIATGARAVIQDWNNEDLTLDVFVHPSVKGKHTELGQEAIPSQLKDRIPAADSPDQADLSLIPSTTTNDTIVERYDPLMRQFARQITVDLDKAHVQYLVMAALHFNFHLYRQPNPLNVFSTVHLELYRLREESAGVKRYVPVDEVNLFHGEHQVKAYKAHGPAVLQEAVLTDFESHYGMKIVNDSDYDLFPYIFNFDPNDYSIQLTKRPGLALPESSSMAPPLRAHNSLKVGYGSREIGKDSTIRVEVPPGKDIDTSFLKLFVSTSFVDMVSSPKAPTTAIERQGCRSLSNSASYGVHGLTF